jgi:hypothetical protein
VEEHDEPTNALAALGDVAGAALGVPLPPIIKKSLFKALGALITGLVDVPVAWLEGKATAIRDETKARSNVLAAGGEAAAREFGSDPNLYRRATTFLGHRLLREQRNRESIAGAAVDDIKQNPPTADAAQSVDDDWLASFARIAEARSSAEMQAYLAKILAGEIRRPGSFSPATLDVASRLTTDLAARFQTFCNASSALPGLSPSVLAQPFGGNPGANELSSVGLSYDVLKHLEDGGLVQGDLGAYYEMRPLIFLRPFEIGGAPYIAEPDEAGPSAAENAPFQQMRVVRYTVAGLELRPIVHMTPNATVVQKLREYLGRFRLALRPLDVPPKAGP